MEKDQDADVPTVLERFVEMNVQAADYFDMLMQFIDNDLEVVFRDGRDARFSPFTSAMGDAFVFAALRAVRLSKQAPDTIKDFIDLDDYWERTKSIGRIRAVTEHGNDETDPRRPRQSLHNDGNYSVDETSMIIEGASKILRGPVNLYDVYKVVRDTADQLDPKPSWRPARHQPRS